MVLVAPVASSMMRTVAPLTTAPCSSVTVPRMVPRNDCATVGALHARVMTNSQSSERCADHQC
jgi:hypothetical protein